jgi:hypothetical protein
VIITLTDLRLMRHTRLEHELTFIIHSSLSIWLEGIRDRSMEIVENVVGRGSGLLGEFVSSGLRYNSSTQYICLFREQEALILPYKTK